MTPSIIEIDLKKMLIKQSLMTDAAFGAFCKKAIIDCMSGCIADDVDALVKECYANSVEKMQKRQNKNDRFYKKSKRSKGAQTELKLDAACGNDAGDMTLAHSDGRITPPSSTTLKKPYGETGHVMLTDEEGHKLRILYGENLMTAINILDAYIDNDGKMAKKYKSHYSVMRKGNWVWEKVQETVLQEKRIANASKGPVNFKAAERERTERCLRGESIDGNITISDSELSFEELKRIYG